MKAGSLVSRFIGLLAVLGGLLGLALVLGLRL